MPSERKALIFPFCWFSTLAELDDSELRAMLAAIGSYAETGTKPEFKGAMKALWNEIQQRLDHDREQYAAVCERNREKALKRWNSTMPQHATACHSIPTHAKRCRTIPKIPIISLSLSLKLKKKKVSYRLQ